MGEGTRRGDARTGQAASGLGDGEAARDPESALLDEEGRGGGKGAGEERGAPGPKGAAAARSPAVAV